MLFGLFCYDLLTYCRIERLVSELIRCAEKRSSISQLYRKGQLNLIIGQYHVGDSSYRGQEPMLPPIPSPTALVLYGAGNRFVEDDFQSKNTPLGQCYLAWIAKMASS
jgi:hypothetical protein